MKQEMRHDYDWKRLGNQEIIECYLLRLADLPLRRSNFDFIRNNIFPNLKNSSFDQYHVVGGNAKRV